MDKSILYDIPKLNKHFKLNGDLRLELFNIDHAREIEVGPFEQKFYDGFDDYPGLLESMADMGLAYSILKNEKEYGSFGLIHMWDGVAEGWMVPSIHISKIKVPFYRIGKQLFDLWIAEWRLVRLCVSVHSGNVRADKWIKKMQFTQEGVLKSFGPSDFADYKMFSRITKRSLHELP